MVALGAGSDEMDKRMGAASTQHGHWMGDLVEMVLMLFNYPGDFDLVFTHKKGETDYSISRSELADAVGGFETPEGLSLAREFLTSQENG